MTRFWRSQTRVHRGRKPTAQPFGQGFASGSAKTAETTRACNHAPRNEGILAALGRRTARVMGSAKRSDVQNGPRWLQNLYFIAKLQQPVTLDVQHPLGQVLADGAVLAVVVKRRPRGRGFPRGLGFGVLMRTRARMGMIICVITAASLRRMRTP